MTLKYVIISVHHKVLPVILLLPTFSTLLSYTNHWCTHIVYSMSLEHVLYIPISVPLAILFFLLLEFFSPILLLFFPDSVYP